MLESNLCHSIVNTVRLVQFNLEVVSSYWWQMYVETDKSKKEKGILAILVKQE